MFWNAPSCIQIENIFIVVCGGQILNLMNQSIYFHCTKTGIHMGLQARLRSRIRSEMPAAPSTDSRVSLAHEQFRVQVSEIVKWLTARQKIPPILQNRLTIHSFIDRFSSWSLECSNVSWWASAALMKEKWKQMWSHTCLRKPELGAFSSNLASSWVAMERTLFSFCSSLSPTGGALWLDISWGKKQTN